MFAVETWTIHNDSHITTMDQALHDTYARALGRSFLQRRAHHIDDKQIRAALARNAPTFVDLVRARRLRYLTRLLTSAPSILLRLVFHHDLVTKWELTIRPDIVWVRLLNKDKLTELPDPLPCGPTPRELQPWLDLARNHKGAWRALMRRATRNACNEDAEGVTPLPSHIILSDGPELNARPPGRTPAIHPTRRGAIGARPDDPPVPHQPRCGRRRTIPMQTLCLRSNLQQSHITPGRQRAHLAVRTKALHLPHSLPHLHAPTSHEVTTRSPLGPQTQQVPYNTHTPRPPPLTLGDIQTNVTHDAIHNPTGHEKLPRLIPAARLPGPLPHHDITGLSANHPFADDDAHHAHTGATAPSSGGTREPSGDERRGR